MEGELRLEALSHENFAKVVEFAELIFPYDKNHTPCPREGLHRSLYGLPYPEDNERNGRYWVVSREERIIGLTGIYLHLEGPDDVAWLGWFGVAPEVRGNGVGRKLLQHTIERARGEGFRAMRLYTTSLPGEEVAQKMYKDFGFELMETEHTPRCTVFFMGKSLR